MRPCVAVVGSRDYPDLHAVYLYVLSLPLGTRVVSGGADGVDAIAEWAAKTYGFPFTAFYPDKKTHRSPACFHVRNEQIVRFCAANDGRIVAFSSTHTVTPGTASTLRYAKRYGVPHLLFVAPYGSAV